LLPYLPTVMAGPAAWDRDRTIRSAIEIREGVVQNPRLLSFQGRSAQYPHLRVGRSWPATARLLSTRTRVAAAV